MKTHTIRVYCKEPDTFGDMASDLDLSDAMRRKFLEYGEYATIELEVDEHLNVRAGRFLPVKK